MTLTSIPLSRTSPGEAPVRTTCPYCGVGCGVLANARRQGRREIAGDRDAPRQLREAVFEGSALGETLGLETRLLHPMVDGERRRAGAKRSIMSPPDFKRIRDTHGPGRSRSTSRASC